MATNYPTSLDDNTSLPNPGSGSFTNNPSHAGQHDTENDAIKALETKLGTGASTASASTVLRGTGSGTTAYGQLVLTTDVTGTLPVANGGTGITSLGTGIATFLGTPSSANLASAVTDETGSGKLVFGTSPNITTPTGIVKGDVGLGNVDNTSDATKNAASVTLTNKTIDGGSNTLTNIGTSSISDSAVTPAKLVAGTGTSWVWQSYTPTWTAASVNPSIGNGVFTAKYVQVGKTVTYSISLTFGSTTTPGSGEYAFTFPIMPKDVTGVGSFYALRSGLAYRTGVCQVQSTSALRCYIDGSGSAIGGTSPYTWTTNDILKFTISYEVS